MKYYTTIGIDVSDRKANICVMKRNADDEPEVMLETLCATTPAGFEEALSRFDRNWPVAFETGTHCRWMEKKLRGMGFKVYVANPAKIPSITKSNTKNDRNDARELARLLMVDRGSLFPVKLRGEAYHQMMQLHQARQTLITIRGMLINEMRGFAKSRGFRLEPCSTGRFHKLDRSGWPADFEALVWPLVDMVETVNMKIAAMDAEIKRLSETPEFRDKVERVIAIPGIGINAATVFVAAIGGDADRFESPRDVGPYLGLVPRQDQSGETDRRLPITKAGSSIVRKILTECANRIMQDNMPDTDIKLKGLRIALHGGNANTAKIATARTAAVVMTALLKHPDKPYERLSERGKEGFERYRAELEYLTMQRSARNASKSGRKNVTAA